MDTSALRSAYSDFLDAAAAPARADTEDGGWTAHQLLAHMISVDSAVTAVALGVAAGSRPGFDNRISLDRWNLDRIVEEHSGTADLVDHVRRQADLLCCVADGLSAAAAAVLVPTFLLSNDHLVADQCIPLAALIAGLGSDHVPAHAQQLRRLREQVQAGTCRSVAKTASGATAR
jgi:hypothetical protein